MREKESSFVWDPTKEFVNIQKHGVDFPTATQVFRDPKRKIIFDEKHSYQEERFFCIGRVGEDVLTVRFSYQEGKIRIIGAGYWRKGARFYDQENKENIEE